MIHAFNGKSKFKLGEASELPDQTKTPFANIAQVQANKTWKVIKNAVGGSIININSNDWNITEFMLVVRCVYNNLTHVITCDIPATAITTIVGGGDIHIGNSYYYGEFYTSFDGSKFTFNLADLRINGASVINTASISIYIKE